MESLWVVAVVVGLFALVWLLVWLGGMRSTEQVQCPLDRFECEVSFQRRLRLLWDPGEKVDVVKCSHLDDPDQITCVKDCLDPTHALRS